LSLFLSLNLSFFSHLNFFCDFQFSSFFFFTASLESNNTNAANGTIFGTNNRGSDEAKMWTKPKDDSDEAKTWTKPKDDSLSLENVKSMILYKTREHGGN
jgi:hypothetical protein